MDPDSLEREVVSYYKSNCSGAWSRVVRGGPGIWPRGGGGSDLMGEGREGAQSEGRPRKSGEERGEELEK